MTRIDEILQCLDGVKQRSGDSWQASCPVSNNHKNGDKKPSLSIGLENGKILLYCHVGCQYEEIKEEIEKRIGKPLSDTYSLPVYNNQKQSPNVWGGSPQKTKQKEKKKKGKLVETYLYYDESSRLAFKKLRYEPKEFLIQDAAGNWGMNGADPVLYRLPELCKTEAYDVVFFVEGEKDADKLVSLGLPATTNFDGAGKNGKWCDSYNKYFAGRVIYILPDNDSVGMEHAEKIAANLHSIAQTVKVCLLPGLSDGEDVSDWLDYGNTKDDLTQFCLRTNKWRPPKYQIGNYVDVIISDQQQNNQPCKILDIYPAYNGARGYIVDFDGEEKPYEESNLELTDKVVIPKIWGVFTLSDARKPRDPLRYVIDDIFMFGSLNVVFGAPGSLKSMLLMDQAVCVAARIDWLDGSYKVEQTPVLWVDLDNGRRRMHERFDAIANYRKLSNNYPLYYVSMPTPTLDATNKQSLIILEQYIKSLKSKFIIIDNLGLVSGSADENSADMASIMSNFRQVADNYDACVNLIHHQRKTYGTSKARAGDSLRGHSSIEAAIDLALLIMREENSNNVIVKSTKDRSVPVTQFQAVFEYSHKGETRELETAFFKPVITISEPEQAKQIILKLLTEGAKNKGQLEAAIQNETGASRARARYYIESMVEAGSVIEEIGERNARIFRLRGIWE